MKKASLSNTIGFCMPLLMLASCKKNPRKTPTKPATTRPNLFQTAWLGGTKINSDTPPHTKAKLGATLRSKNRRSYRTIATDHNDNCPVLDFYNEAKRKVFYIEAKALSDRLSEEWPGYFSHKPPIKTESKSDI